MTVVPVPSGASFELRSREDLLGMVPYLLGYHPRDSVVVLLVGSDNRIVVAARHHLADSSQAIAARISVLASRHTPASLVIVGYGPLTATAAVADLAADLSPGGRVSEVLLVAVGHYFCLACPCPASDGIAFDPAETATAASAAFAGLVALPSREQLLALVDPDPIEQARTAAAMRARPPARPAALVRYLMGIAETGARLTAGQVGQLAQVICEVPVRDVAWAATAQQMWQRDLWLDVTRRVPDAFVAAPASLAGWCAWMRGEEALAFAALRRALAIDPTYRMAQLVATALANNVSARNLVGSWPHIATDPGSPS